MKKSALFSLLLPVVFSRAGEMIALMLNYRFDKNPFTWRIEKNSFPQPYFVNEENRLPRLADAL